MKYKVGNKVMVKKGLKAFKKYGADYFTPRMNGYDTVTIKKIIFGDLYRVEENCYNYTDEMIAGLAECNEKIVITSDGTTTTARLFDGKNVIRSASAKCSPDDTFDFEIGAKLAFDRLTIIKKNEPKFNSGDKVEELEKEKFVPHLVSEDLDENLGIIGEETNYVDKNGNKLFVGDTVCVHGKFFDYHNSVVCEGEDGAFVMGFRCACNSKKVKLKILFLKKNAVLKTSRTTK